jgi:hypothetical protein
MPRQPRKHVFELRQLHLQLAFTSAGVAREDIENELRAIDDAGVDHALYIPLLRRREVVIEQNHVRGNRGGCACDFLQLALADQRGGLRTIPALREFAGDLGARAPGQRAEFIE